MPRTRASTNLAVTILAASIAALSPSCNTGDDDGRPRPRLVLLFAPCTLGTEFLTPYGASADLTPNLAAFAEDAVVFERHHTESGQSGIAYASLFSGTQAARHGVFHHPTLLSDDLFLITEAFAAEGYKTWFWSGQDMGSARLNYGQGVPPGHVFKRDRDDAAGLTANDSGFESLLADLERDPNRRAYVQVNFTLTHHAYQKHVPEDELPELLREAAAALDGFSFEQATRLVELYDEHRLGLQWDAPATFERLGLSPEDVRRMAAVLEVIFARNVRELDRWFGRTLERIEAHGLAAESVVAFTADHGEVLYRENALFHWTHGFQLAPEVLQVPLLVRAPGVAAGRHAGVTRSIDVFPTLAGLAGLADPGCDGTDLSPALLRGAAPPDQRAFSHTSVFTEAQAGEYGDWSLRNRFFEPAEPESMWVGAREGDLLFRLRRLDPETWRLSVFDLARDPGLTEDLHDASDPTHARMEEQLTTYRTQLVEAYETFAQQPGRNLSLREQLRSLRKLGYVR